MHQHQAYAQGRGNGRGGNGKGGRSVEQKASRKADRLKTQLNLSDEQHRRVQEIFLTELTAMELLRANNPKEQGEPRSEEFRKERKDIRANTESQMKEVLTKEQMAKWNELKDEKKEQSKERRKSKRTEG